MTLHAVCKAVAPISFVHLSSLQKLNKWNTSIISDLRELQEKITHAKILFHLFKSKNNLGHDYSVTNTG